MRWPLRNPEDAGSPCLCEGIRRPVALLVVSGADMPNRPYLDLPRHAWERPVSREPAVVTMLSATGGEARRSRSADESFRPASAEDDDEAEPSGGPEALGGRMRSPSGLSGLAGRRWAMT